MKRAAALALCLGLPCRDGLAAGLDAGAGARAAGLAHAVVALADDTTAVIHNPAGLSQLSAPEMCLQQTRFLTRVSDDSKVGLSLAALALPLRRGRWGALGLAYRTFDGASYFKDRTVVLGYGRR